MHDLLIRNGTVVTEEGVRELDLAVDREQIAALYPRTAAPGVATKVVDATGMLVLPGGIDPHVHYEVLATHRGVVSERMDTSVAAAFGGNTTVVDFAFHEGEPTLHDALAERRRELDGHMAVDYGLHLTLTGHPSFELLDEIADLVREGCPTFKTFMSHRLLMDDGDRFGVMRAVAEAGGMSVIHAEDDAIIRWLTEMYAREGKTHGAYIGETRGSLAEEAAVRRALLLAERSGCALLILHIAAEPAVRALAESRRRGHPSYGETLAAYLSVTKDDLWQERPAHLDGSTFPNGGRLVDNCPLPKGREDREALWAALAENHLQVVSSDHFLTKAVDRDTEMGSTTHNMQAGQAAVELRIPLLYSLGVAGGRLSLTRFVDLMATNAAKLMGLYPKKGTLAVGSDADILVFDPARRWQPTGDALHIETDYCCWHDWELTGKPITVFLRGRAVVENEQAVGTRREGRFLRRAISPQYLRKPVRL